MLLAENIVSGYDDTVILEGVTVRADDSSITAIIGPNGSGKSTLLKTIYGFLKPKQGRILLDGRDVTGTPPYEMAKMGVAYLFQRRSIFPQLTVEENLKVGAWHLRSNRQELAAAIKEIYDRFPMLEKVRESPAVLLSGGYARLLEVAKALIARPKTVLMDEPSVGLAPKIAAQIYREVARMKEDGLSILLVDQNVRMAAAASDYLYVLKGVKKVAEGSRGDFETSLREVVKEWLRL